MEVKEPAAKYHPKMTSAEYLDWERKEEEKHEYLEGEILNMSGASLNHNKIHTNLIGELYLKLKGKACSVYPAELRLYVKAKESYFYPDATIICGDPEMADDKLDMITNPSVIFEILSPSTSDYDMGRKFFFYMQISSLKEYIMIDSQKQSIRVWRKSDDHNLQFQELSADTDFLEIASIEQSIRIEDLYSGVKF